MPPLGLPSLPNLLPSELFPGHAVDNALVKDKTKRKRLSLIIRDAGWTGADAIRARAVTNAESSNDPTVYNGSCCYGLFQIHAAAHHEDPEKLKDAQYNANVAYDIWKASGRTFDKDWLDSMPGWVGNNNPPNPIITWKQTATASAQISSGINEVVDPLLSPLETVAAFFGLLSQSSTWFRVGKVVIGFALVGAGVIGLVAIAVEKFGGKVPIPV